MTDPNTYYSPEAIEALKLNTFVSEELADRIMNPVGIRSIMASFNAHWELRADGYYHYKLKWQSHTEQ